jgi:hypothetical protein
MKLGPEELQVEFIVVETNTDNILGASFLLEHCRRTDLEEKMLVTKRGVKIPLVMKGSRYTIARVYAAESVQIPARSTALINVRPPVGRTETHGTAEIVEPIKTVLRKCSANLTMLPTLVTMEEGQGVVEIVNEGEEELKIPKSALLGTMRPLRVQDLDYLENQEAASCNQIQEGNEEAWLEEIQFGSELSVEELSQVKELVRKYSDVFSKHSLDVGITPLVTHEISLSDSRPVQIPARRVPPHLLKELDKELDEMLAKGIIRPSYSQYCSPIVIVPKKDGSIRIVNDYRTLNSRINYVPYPLPNIQETFASFHGAQVFSSLDLQQGYFQIPVREEDKHVTAFATLHRGMFEYQTLPMGLSNSPGTFQRCMNIVLSGAQAYLDDIAIFSKSFSDHLQHLEEIFSRLRAAQLKLKPKKCQLLVNELHYLGHVISARGIATDPAKTEAVRSWPLPSDVGQLRGFLGLCNYYAKFVKNYAEIAAPLHSLTKKSIKNFKSQWKPEHN